MPATVLPTSSAAICAATTEPWPPRSAYRPDMSLITPMTSLPLLAPAAGAATPGAGADPADGAASLPPLGGASFLHAAAAHSAAAHRVNSNERSAIRLGSFNIAAPVFGSNDIRALDSKIDTQSVHARRQVRIRD